MYSTREFVPYDINVNTITPSRVLTDIVYANHTPGELRTFISKKGRDYLLARLGTAGDIAHLVLFLALDESSFINVEVNY